MKRILFLAILSLFSSLVHAQVDSTQLLLDQMLAEEQNNSKDFVRATFKNSRLINFPTCEVVGKSMLDFRIGHRFGELNSGAKNAFGLDGPAGIRLGLDYGVTDWLNVGIGRSSIEKLIDN
jgi:hypothetical protein